MLLLFSFFVVVFHFSLFCCETVCYVFRTRVVLLCICLELLLFFFFILPDGRTIVYTTLPLHCLLRIICVCFLCRSLILRVPAGAGTDLAVAFSASNVTNVRY